MRARFVAASQQNNDLQSPFGEIDPISWPRVDAHFGPVDPCLPSADGACLPLSVVVDGAHRQNVKPPRPKSEAIIVQRPEPGLEQRQGLCPDKDYNYGEVRALAGGIHCTAHPDAG